MLTHVAYTCECVHEPCSQWCSGNQGEHGKSVAAVDWSVVHVRTAAGYACPSPPRTCRLPTHAPLVASHPRCDACRRNLDLGLGGEWLYGDIAVLSVYNRELSVQEEQLLAQAYGCRFNLVPEGTCCAYLCVWAINLSPSSLLTNVRHLLCRSSLISRPWRYGMLVWHVRLGTGVKCTGRSLCHIRASNAQAAQVQ